MKVLLIGNYVADGQTSMLAFRRILERELPKAGCDVRVIAPAKHLTRISPNSRLWKWLGYIDKFILFLPTLRSHLRWADVVHIGDHSNSMYVRWVKSRPSVVTCHDVIAIQAGLGQGYQVSWTGRLFQRLISEGLGRADLVACVSDMTKRELLRMGLATEDKVTVVTNGLNDDFAPVPREEAARLIARFGLTPDSRYLMHIGWEIARKNRPGVVNTFIELQERAKRDGRQPVVDRLLFVGPFLEPQLAEPLAAHGLTDRAQNVRGISHEELRALYSCATALLFPSFQEGFGWPIIEAQACGCPVFTTNLPPMNEIGGPGAVYVDPNDPVAMAAAIEEAAPRLGEMRRLGLENAVHYSAAQMTANYIAAYQRAIDARKAGK